MKNSYLVSGFLVAVGAASYGMLTTFVKLAEKKGYTIFEITMAEYIIGVIGLVLLDSLVKNRKRPTKTYQPASRRNIRNLMLTGASMGVTTFVYYLSVKYISVSIAIVMLMQSVWIGVVFDAIFNKTKPGLLKILAVIVVLIGTLLATNIFFSEVVLDWRGMALGFLAAISYSITILATNRVALDLAPTTRSKWMVIGAFVIVAVITLPVLIQHFKWDILYTWGIFFGFFGAVLPPILLNYAMPKINLGIGAIITSMELPVAVSLAYFLLNEKVNLYQWLGIILILIAIAGMNIRKN